ncbi:MAG: T9SS type A sorting domain-containing protein [bacterium]
MKKIFIPFFLVLLFSFNNHFAQSTLYVSAGGSSTPPYDSWATAATSIQVAVDAAIAGDMVLVDDGVFVLTTYISVNKAITVKSRNGNSFTTIDGNNVTRGFHLTNSGVVIDGFTITNGYTTGYGGGVQCDNGTVQNCIIENCAARDGGGVALDNAGIVNNCIIRNNTADWGGGIRFFNGTARGCLITGNTATPHGGGVNIWSQGTVQNCTITNNTATDGAGIRLWNNGVVENSVIYFNTGSENFIIDAGHGNSLSYSCTTPLYTGTGNISDDPLFVNAGTGDYHLSNSSTLINAGLYNTWMDAATDLDGNDRILDGTVDMGAYEFENIENVTDGPIPIASWPVGNPTMYVNPPTLNWYLGVYDPGLTYEIQCIPATDLVWPEEYATSSDMSYPLPAALTGGAQYAWRVRSVTNPTTKSEWSTPELFTMVENPPEGPVVPIASWPIGNPTEYINPPTLYWYLGTSTTGLTYEIQCMPASEPAWPEDYATSSTMSYTFESGLMGGVQYAWRVRSVSGEEKSEWSAPEFFTMVLNTAGGPVVPILSWPIGDPTEYNNPPTLYWYLGVYDAGLSYEIQCIPASESEWPESFETSSTMSFTFTSGLTGGVQYMWRVRSVLDTEKSEWSAPELFTMVANTPGGPVVPIAAWPIDNPTEYNNPPTLYWYLGVNDPGLTYEVQCVPASAETWPEDYSTSSIMAFTFASELTRGIQYMWRVRSVLGSEKSDWSTPALFTMAENTIGAPVIPILSWPIGNTTNYINPPVLYWYLNASGEGLTYEIQYMPASDTTWTEDYATSSTMSFAIDSALVDGVQYKWRVRSVSGSQKSDWSIPELFSMASNNSPVQPVTGSPSNSVTVRTASTELFWYLPTSATVNSTYEIQVADNANFENAKIFSSDKSNIQVDGLENGKNYFWKVRSKDDAGNTSYYSGTGKFKVNYSITTIKEEVVPTSFSLTQNYPNPFNPSTVISFQLPVVSEVQLKVYDILGKKVATLINESKPAGNYEVKFDASNLSSGIYFYQLNAGSFTATKKLILLK